MERESQEKLEDSLFAMQKNMKDMDLKVKRKK